MNYSQNVFGKVRTSSLIALAKTDAKKEITVWVMQDNKSGHLIITLISKRGYNCGHILKCYSKMIVFIYIKSNNDPMGFQTVIPAPYNSYYLFAWHLTIGR